MPPQIIPRIDAAFVTIVPFKADGVAAYRRYHIGARRSLIHGQYGFRLWLGHAGGAA